MGTSFKQRSIKTILRAFKEAVFVQNRQKSLKNKLDNPIIAQEYVIIVAVRLQKINATYLF